MEPKVLINDLQKFLENLTENTIIDGWNYVGITDIAYGTPGANGIVTNLKVIDLIETINPTYYDHQSHLKTKKKYVTWQLKQCILKLN